MDLFKPVIYTVKKISGDYAILLTPDNIENTVAMALLPIETQEGCKLLWENLSYSIYLEK